jgi:hypothetical protein
LIIGVVREYLLIRQRRFVQRGKINKKISIRHNDKQKSSARGLWSYAP